MKEYPIIMSGNHPKLILDGIKTQTRRVIKLNGEIPKLSISDDLFKANMAKCPDLCPYGQVGDRLWVREKFYFRVGSPDAVIYFDGTEKFRTGKIIENFANVDRLKWRPSIHMFKEFSRITLEITEVRVERLNQMTEADAFAEGCRNQVLSNMAPNFDIAIRPASNVFRELWDSLNAKRGYGWEVNPWCWVISFKRT